MQGDHDHDEGRAVETYRTRGNEEAEFIRRKRVLFVVRGGGESCISAVDPVRRDDHRAHTDRCGLIFRTMLKSTEAGGRMLVAGVCRTVPSSRRPRRAHSTTGAGGLAPNPDLGRTGASSKAKTIIIICYNDIIMIRDFSPRRRPGHRGRTKCTSRNMCHQQLLSVCVRVTAIIGNDGTLPPDQRVTGDFRCVCSCYVYDENARDGQQLVHDERHRLLKSRTHDGFTCRSTIVVIITMIWALSLFTKAIDTV